METADIVIAGTGFAGASTAYHLARQGARRIIMVEREAVPGVHASGRNAALAFQVLSDPVEARLAVEGARFIAKPPDGFSEAPLLRRCGSLLVANEAGRADLLRACQAGQALGIAGELLEANEAIERVAALRGAPFAVACWNPFDGVVDIHALLQGYITGARSAGARVEFRRTVTHVQVDRGRVTAVDTDRGRVQTSALVNAAGAWAGEIGVLAGVGRRSLAPRRRHLFQTEVDMPINSNWPFVWHNDIDTYFRPEGSGLLMSPCDATPHPPQPPTTDSAAERLLAEKMDRAFPALATARITSAWACLRTFTSDGRFLIGPDPEIDGLVWVAGLGGHGMTTSFAVGRLGAAAVCGQINDELRYFSPARLVS